MAHKYSCKGIFQRSELTVSSWRTSALFSGDILRVFFRKLAKGLSSAKFFIHSTFIFMRQKMGEHLIWFCITEHREKRKYQLERNKNKQGSLCPITLNVKCILTKEFDFVLVVGQSMNNGHSSTCIPYGLLHKVQVRVRLLSPKGCCFRLKWDFKTCLSASIKTMTS